MNLYLDIGNTKIKWYWEGLAFGAEIYAKKTSGELIALIANKHPKVEEIYCSTVVNNQVITEVLAELENLYQTPVTYPKVEFQTELLEVCSTNYITLGVDRWLAMLAARKLYPQQEFVLVTLGTAATLDHVAQNGKHLGGLIQPGLVTALRSLQANTCLDFQLGLEFKSTKPACDTNSAIFSGIAALYQGYLDNLAAKFTNSKLILTGGDAEVLMPLLESNWDLQPGLVIKGLQQYSKQKKSSFTR